MDSDTIRGRLTNDEQARIDALMAAWFVREADVYTSEELRAVKPAGGGL